jgi:hypothetical protein
MVSGGGVEPPSPKVADFESLSTESGLAFYCIYDDLDGLTGRLHAVS